MASDVDTSVPVAGNPTTLSVRENFTIIKTEIEELQDRADGELANRPMQIPHPPAAAPTTDTVLTWNGTAWVPQTVKQIDGKQVVATTPTTGQQLRYDGTNWVNATNTVKLINDVVADGDASVTTGVATEVVALQGKEVLAKGANSPLAGQALVYDGTRWVPTSGGAAPQSIIFRSFGILPPDIHTWIPDGTQGLFAGEGNNVLNAPDDGHWRFIAHSSAVSGEQMVLAMSESENGRLLQKTKVSGVWSNWTDYVTQDIRGTLDQFGPNLTPNPIPDSMGFSVVTLNPPQMPNAWDTQYSGNTGGTLAVPLTQPTVAGHWYRVQIQIYSGPPYGRIWFRIGGTTQPADQVGQQVVVAETYSSTSMYGNVVQATGAFGWLAYQNATAVGSHSGGMHSPVVQELTPDTSTQLVTAAPTAGTAWSSASPGVNGVYTHATGNTATLAYALTAPMVIGQRILVNYHQVGTGTTGFTVYLRTGPGVTAGQQQLSAAVFDLHGAVGIATSAFTHIEVVPPTAVGGTFQLLAVYPLPNEQPVDPSGLTVRMRGDNLVIGSNAGRSLFGIGNLIIGKNAMVGANGALPSFGSWPLARNVALGENALRNGTGIYNNVAVGYGAASNVTSAYNIVVVGQRAGRSLTTANGSVVIGSNAAVASTSGSNNICIGSGVAPNMTTGGSNVMIGYLTGRANTTGTGIVAIGHTALYSEPAYTATGQTAVGSTALYSLTSGTYNTALGNSAMYAMTTGSNNVAIGYNAGRYTTGTTAGTTSENSVFIGTTTRTGGNDRTNQIVIGHDAYGEASNAIVLGNTSIGTTNSLKCRCTTVTQQSDVRLKENVEAANLDLCLQAVRDLPVRRYTWNEKYSNTGPDKHVIGFVADDVISVFPKSVTTCTETFKDGNVIENCKSTTMSEALPTLWGAVQKLIQENEGLKAEIAELKEHHNGSK